MKIGFIGAGNMAEALIKGFLNSKRINPQDILASDIIKDRLKYLNNGYKISVMDDNQKLIEASQLVILSVKPQNFSCIINDLNRSITDSHLVVSIMAKLTLKDIQDKLIKRIKLVRVMPNILASINLSLCGILKSNTVNNEEYKKIKDIFSTVGELIELKNEEQMDILTVLGGCLPAVICLLVEALTDAGIEQGLEYKLSYNIVTSVIFGTAKLLKTESTSDLKYKVTSPGGITCAILSQLEDRCIRGALLSGIKAGLKKIGY
jgi:pyrroline-5-carboxylate reductase